MSTTTDVIEMAEDHATTIAALHATFGDDAYAMVARIEYTYATSLASWRRCVDDEVATYMRSRYGAA